MTRWPWVARVLNENNCSSCKTMYSLTGRLSELSVDRAVGDRSRRRPCQGGVANLDRAVPHRRGWRCQRADLRGAGSDAIRKQSGTSVIRLSSRRKKAADDANAYPHTVLERGIRNE